MVTLVHREFTVDVPLQKAWEHVNTYVDRGPQLTRMGLDWDLPSYPPAKAKKDQAPLQVNVDLGHKDARTWYDRAAAWMYKHQPRNDQLRRIRDEAAALLKLETRVRNHESRDKTEGSVK